MAHRVGYLIEAGVDPEKICAISFSKKSGLELEHRITWQAAVVAIRASRAIRQAVEAVAETKALQCGCAGFLFNSPHLFRGLVANS